jgi:hypothetical protein
MAQLQYKTTEKLCVDGDVSKLLYIDYVENVIVANLQHPSALVGINATTGKQIWSKPWKAGYGVKTFGKQIIFTKNVNAYDDKTNKVVMGEWLYTLDPLTGNLKDSVLLKFSVVTPSRSGGLTENFAAVIQAPDNTFKSVIANKKTGAIVYTLFSETGSDIPNAIQVDKTDQYVAVGCANGTKGFFLYDFRTGKQLLNVAGAGDIHCIEFTSDSKYCLYYQAKKLKVINLTTLKLEKEIAVSSDSPNLAIHPNNEDVVLCGYSTAVPILFLNWKTGLSKTSTENTKGGIPVFSPEGFLFMPLTNGVQCFVNKDKLPYLAKLSFENSSHSTTENSAITTTPIAVNGSTSSFGVGSRAYIFYSGDGKYYSGVITEITADGFNVVYDDASRATVKKSDVKILPALKVGDKVQVRRSDAKFYNCTIKAITGDAVQVEYSTGTEWVSIRSIMQVD